MFHTSIDNIVIFKGLLAEKWPKPGGLEMAANPFSKEISYVFSPSKPF
jgi:hypothetical protein